MQCFVNSDNQVPITPAAPFVESAIGKPLSVSARAARIQIEHGVTLRRVNLKRRIERIVVHAVRATVNIENHRVLAILAPVDSLNQPRLNLSSVETLEAKLLRLDQRDGAAQAIVMPADARQRVSSANPHLARMQRIAYDGDKSTLAKRRPSLA